jgi:hypothetical protein
MVANLDEGPSLGTSKFCLYFSGSRIPLNPQHSGVFVTTYADSSTFDKRSLFNFDVLLKVYTL